MMTRTLKFARTLLLPLICLAPGPLTWAADTRLTLPDFSALEGKAIESVNVSFGPWFFRAAALFLDKDDPDTANVKKLLSGVESLQIRNYEFAADAAYAVSQIDAIRHKLAGFGWAHPVQVHDRNSNEDVDVYLSMQDGRSHGFAVVVTGPREFTVIHLSGSISLDDLQALDSHLHLAGTNFHVPQI